MKARWMAMLAAVLAVAAGSGCVTAESLTPQPAVQPAQPTAPERYQTQPSSPSPYQVETVAEQLQVPWALAIAPDGRLFFTERPGTVRVIADGQLLPEPVIQFEAPFVQEGEGGLLGLSLDPAFAQNQFLYVYHTYRDGDKIYNRLLRLRESNNRAVIDKILIDRIPGNRFHNGGRIAFGPDGYLYVTTGDALEPQLAQQRDSLAGKILRISRDGAVPADNPFPGSPVYSLGHRNPQGLAWNPENGQLYASEHGQSAHDEMNRILPGANYGWPLIQGDEQADGLRRPVLHSGTTTWAPSGMTFVRQGPWSGRLLVANLRGEQVLSLRIPAENPDRAAEVEPLFPDGFGRIRDVVEGPDGSLYLLTNNRDGRGTVREGDDKIIRLRPTAR